MNTAPTPLLAVEGLSVSYGAVRALSDLSLAVPEGTAFAVLGANGAGKSSLLRAILGWERPVTGRIVLDGHDVTRWSPWRRAAAGLAVVPERGRVFTDLTVGENLRVGAYLRGARPTTGEVAAACERFPILARRLDDRAGALSGGQQQMLAIARALIARPRLLVIDEVTSGLAPQLVTEVFGALRELARGGMTLLLAEQNVRRALEVADHALVLQRGKIVLAGRADELRGDERLLHAYLGSRAEGVAQ